jgi:spermidine/putrescine transport system ATP-binding protein
VNGGLEIRNIQKRFGSQTALSSVDLVIPQGEFFSLLGPSGCGKSTLLRILAGLEAADSGEIYWDGKRIDQMPARERPFNMVFQKYALFPHLTVFENIAFGLRVKKVSSGELRARVHEALELVNMKAFGERLPETLSGGQAQRVALARALVNRPACVLLDEPLTALDQKLREYMQTELRLLQKRLGLTFIFVTHDQEEAMLLSDRIAVMDQGRVEQVAAPRELYEAPQSIFSARFIGSRNELGLSSLRADGDWLELKVELGGKSSSLRGKPGSRTFDAASDSAGRVFIRPERVAILSGGRVATPGHNVLDATVVQVLFRGTYVEAIVSVGANQSVGPQPLLLRVFADANGPQLMSGEKVRIEFAPADTVVFHDNAAGEARV